jgi:hypothetical protein
MANTIRDLKIVNQATNKTIPITSVSSDVTAKELLSAYATKIGLPAGTPGTLTRKLTRKQLLPEQTLGGAGVESGETLIADMEMVPG